MIILQLMLMALRASIVINRLRGGFLLTCSCRCGAINLAPADKCHPTCPAAAFCCFLAAAAASLSLVCACVFIILFVVVLPLYECKHTSPAEAKTSPARAAASMKRKSTQLLCTSIRRQESARAAGCGRRASFHDYLQPQR